MSNKILYITEPNEINGESKRLIKYGYKLIEGDTQFKKNYNPDTETLLIRSYTKIDSDALTKLPNLKHVIRVGVGLDNIDTKLCSSKGIKVYNAAGSNSNAVAEYVVCVTLMSLRKVHQLDKYDLEKWDRFKFLGEELENKTVGLLGFGNIAQLVYKKMSALGCNKFYVSDPYINPKQYKSNKLHFCDIDSLFKKSDIISIHIPLSDSTYHLIDDELLNKIKRGSVLINTSRGGVVSEKMIIKYLKKGAFTYIADVFETEPKIREDFLNITNFIGTPHIASLTEESNKKMVELAIENFTKGKFV